MSENLSFQELLAAHLATKEAELKVADEAAEEESAEESSEEPSSETEESTEEVEQSTEEVEQSAEEAEEVEETEEKETGEEKTSGLAWYAENEAGLSKLAEDISSVLDSDANRELFGRCLDAVTLLKVGSYLDAGGGTAEDLVLMANDLYQRVKSL